MAIGNARCVGREPPVSRERGLAGKSAEALELGVVANGEDDVTISGGEDLVRHKGIYADAVWATAQP